MIQLSNESGLRDLLFYRAVGGHSKCETPDPFPNSEAKALTLMIVRERESKLPPTFNKALWLNITGP